MGNIILNNGSVHIGYNGVPWSFSNKKTDKFEHWHSKTSRPVGSFREEAILAAKDIRATFPAVPLYALYSGGADSEAMLEAFRLASVPVTVVIVKFTDGSNSHDIWHAFSYLKKINFTGNVKVIDLNIKDWLKSSECIDIARSMQTTELILTHIFKIASDHLKDGIVMTAHEEPSLWKEDGSWVYNRNEKHYGLHKYFLTENISGVPSFFQWSVELLTAFVFNKHYLTAYSGLYNNKIWSAEQLKYHFYKDQFSLTPRTKYTGFENLISEIVIANENWVNSLEFPWTREVDTEIFTWGNEINYVRKSDY